MMAQMLGAQFNPMSNPMVQAIVQMKQQGMTPDAALQRLSQQDARFQQLRGQTPRQLDQMARATIQNAGVDPNAVMGRLKMMF